MPFFIFLAAMIPVDRPSCPLACCTPAAAPHVIVFQHLPEHERRQSTTDRNQAHYGGTSEDDLGCYYFPDRQ